MADSIPTTGKELTGRKVLFIAVSAFSVIIGVNVYMAYSAVNTFPGLEVKNTYVASQTFDADRKAQEALGWTATAAIDGTTLRVDITGADGQPAELAGLSGMLGRTTERQQDQSPVFSESSTGTHIADIGAVGAGKWELRIEAFAPDGTAFRQRLILRVPES